ncbi:MAG: PEP-CTERM sorting domain-containing protein [Phycisphaerales bacterium JB063]
MILSHRLAIAAIGAAVSCCAAQTQAAVVFDEDVTPDIIFGDGNANGGFTVDTNAGVELGLRAKLRHNASGVAENTFNSNGDGTYTFDPGVGPGQSFPTAEWSFEWSINSNVDGTSGWNLDDLNYVLSMTSTVGTFIPAFDPINAVNPGTGMVQWDHAIGTNATANGDGASIPNSADDAAGYAALIAGNNVAQNSWKPHWFTPGFDPNAVGDYTFTLTAYDGLTEIASTEIVVSITPEPGSLAILGLGGLLVARRRRA